MSGLSDLAYARHSDPKTSHAAAASVEVHLAHLESTVLKAIPAKGATWDELHELTGIDKASISPRLKPLRKKGLIEVRYDTDYEAIKRPGKSGRGQIVWFRK